VVLHRLADSTASQTSSAPAAAISPILAPVDGSITSITAPSRALRRRPSISSSWLRTAKARAALSSTWAKR